MPAAKSPHHIDERIEYAILVVLLALAALAYVRYGP